MYKFLNMPVKKYMTLLVWKNRLWAVNLSNINFRSYCKIYPHLPLPPQSYHCTQREGKYRPLPIYLFIVPLISITILKSTLPYLG